MSHFEGPAPELSVSHWLNTEKPLTLAGLRGRVVLVEAFQMLCPGCVSHGLPQATRVYETFPHDQIQVIGLHTVFEHHEANSVESLKAFLYEYRIRFPVAIDQPSDQAPTPVTMAQYRMRGTPSLLLFDRQGQLRKQHFGSVPDLQLGAEVMMLLMEAQESEPMQETQLSKASNTDRCSAEACEAPQ